MPEMHDYLSLASEAGDLAASTPDPELAAIYRRLATSYQNLAHFHDRLSVFFNVEGDDRNS
jgi:hypothetical protein